MTETYHNTTHERGQILVDYQGQTLCQDGAVLEFFQDHPRQLFTPSEIHHRVFAPNVPLTSTRRAISNLTRKGKLVKTNQKKDGPFGRPEYLWRLDISPGQGELF